MEELEPVDWTIVGLSEIRREGEGCMEMTKGEKFYFNGEGSRGGTGFLVNNSIADQITAFKTYSSRITKIIWKPSKNRNIGRIKIIQVYAPTSSSPEEDVGIFYNHLQSALDEDTCSHTIICGDWNSKVGGAEGEEAVGKHGIGTRNDRGTKMVEFVESNRLFIMNTFFKKHESLKWTWVSPDGNTQNEIDFFVCNKKKLIKDVVVDENINIGSDHRALKAVINIGIKKCWKKNRWDKVELNQLKSNDYEKILNVELEKNETETNDLNELENRIVKSIKQATMRISEKEYANINEKRKIPKEIKKLMERRRKLKRKGKEKIEFSEISKTIRKKIKEWSDKNNVEEMKKAIKTGTSLKKCLKQQRMGRTSIVAMKDKDGRVRNNSEEILQIISDYYKELFSLPESKRRALDHQEGNLQITNDQQNNLDHVGYILREEVEYVLKKLKSGKTGGLDRVSNEELKAGGKNLIEDLCYLFNQCIEQKQIPDSWLQSRLIILFKKGDKQEIKNYRPINLLSSVYKAFMSIITARMCKQLDFYSPVDQVGFKKNFSTNDGILIIKQLLSKAYEYNLPLALLFIDFEKAFDSVYPEAIKKAMESCGINKTYRDLISYIYDKAEITISVGNKKKTISIEKGLRQGDVTSAKLFTAVLEEVFKELNWNCYGFNINGEKLNRIKFADDVVLIGVSKEEVEAMLKELSEEAIKVGLIVNMEKTKIMTVNCNNSIIKLENRNIEEVKEFIYLGQLIGIKDSTTKEISRRISLGWRAYGAHRKLFRSNIEIEDKVKLWNSVVKPVLLYGCETWSLTKRNIDMIRVAVRRMERSMLKIGRNERKRNQWIRQQTNLEDIAKVMIIRKWKWAGHVVRTNDGRWTRKILDWVPLDKKRKRGRPTIKWDHEMKICCGDVTWKRVAMDRIEWKRMGWVYVDEWLNAE